MHERMGRRLESVTEVTAYERDAHFAIRIVEGPLPIDGDWRLTGAEGGTRVQFHARGEAPARMRLLSPLVALAVREKIRRDHRRLAEALESAPPV